MTNGVGDTNRSGYYEAGETPEGRNELTVTDIEKIEDHSISRNSEATKDGAVTIFEIDAFYAFRKDGKALSVPEGPVVEDQGALSAPPGDAADITDRFSFRDAVTAYLKANYGNLTGDELTKVENVALDWVAREKNSVFSDANFEAWKAAPETIEYLNKVNDPNAQVGKITDAGATADTAEQPDETAAQPEPAAAAAATGGSAVDTRPLEVIAKDKVDLQIKIAQHLQAKFGENYNEKDLERIHNEAIAWIENNPETAGGGYANAFEAWKKYYDAKQAGATAAPGATDEPAKPAEPAAGTAETKPAPKKEEDDGPDSDSIL